MMISACSKRLRTRSFGAGISFFQDAQLVFGGELPALGVRQDFWLRYLGLAFTVWLSLC